MIEVLVAFCAIGMVKDAQLQLIKQNLIIIFGPWWQLKLRFIYIFFSLFSRLERSKVRVTFFHSGQPQQICTPDPFSSGEYDDYDYDHHQHPWKHYDPLDPHGAEQPLLSHSNNNCNNLNNNIISNNNHPSSHQHTNGSSMSGVQTATIPAYDRQIRWDIIFSFLLSSLYLHIILKTEFNFSWVAYVDPSPWPILYHNFRP